MSQGRRRRQPSGESGRSSVPANYKMSNGHIPKGIDARCRAKTTKWWLELLASNAMQSGRQSHPLLVKLSWIRFDPPLDEICGERASMAPNQEEITRVLRIDALCSSRVLLSARVNVARSSTYVERIPVHASTRAQETHMPVHATSIGTPHATNTDCQRFHKATMLLTRLALRLSGKSHVVQIANHPHASSWLGCRVFIIPPKHSETASSPGP